MLINPLKVSNFTLNWNLINFRTQPKTKSQWNIRKSGKYQASPFNFHSSHPWNFIYFLAGNLNILAFHNGILTKIKDHYGENLQKLWKSVYSKGLYFIILPVVNMSQLFHAALYLPIIIFFKLHILY